MQSFLPNTIKLAKYYKKLGEQTFDQLSDEQLFFKPTSTSNSIAIIVNHLAGNMLSRWTNVLSEDGEKSWRNREAEFEEVIHSKSELLARWNEGWNCFISSLENLSAADLNKIVYIRNEGHTLTDAIQRQMAHYPYHIGQIVLLGKIQLDDQWESLSIPKGQSENYNAQKFEKKQSNLHFTDQV